MNKILIIVRGGNIQSVGCTEDCEVAIIDWDNIIEGGETEPVVYGVQTSVPENDLDFQVEAANDAIRENVTNEDEEKNLNDDELLKRYQ